MQNLTPKEKNKILAAANLIEKGDMAVLQKILEFSDAIENNAEKVDEAVLNAENKVETLITLVQEANTKLDDKIATIENGKDYVLTDEDKQAIADSITVPVVEKVIERTEVIKEIPVFNETVIEQIKEVAVLDPETLPQYGSKFKEALELLKADDRLDVSAIKGISKREGKLSDSIINRAIGIVDQRTSFLINKVSNLQNQVDNSGGSGASAFTDLTDVPSSYSGEGTKALRVNAGETALEFFTLAGGGDALKADPLSQFASTTSLQLKGVISDETGSGALVFADTPTLVTPVLGAATGTSLQLSGLTASEILITDASKNITSAAVATYPSLTELTYVKGVTSAIQTQLNAKLTSSNIVATITNGVTTNAPSEDAVFDALALKAPLASPTFTGTVTLPTGLTGVIRADSGVVSVDSDVTDLVSASSEILAGKVELATDAETVTGTDTARATTPANITAKMAAPGAIGGTTASTATFTTLTVNTNANPDANDGAGLGTSALGWSDLFLAEGAVINWDNGDATLTQAGDVVTLAGADLKITTPGTAATSVATIDGTQTLTNKSIVATQLTGTSYTFPANNTSGTAAMTLVPFEDHPLATYAGTFSWNSTPPSSITSQQYAWSRIGGTVTLFIQVVYSVAGTTNTTCTITLPSDCPTPATIVTTGDAASEFMYPLCGGRIEGGITGNPTAVRGGIRRNAADDGYEISMVVGSTSAIHLQATVIYRTS